MEAFFAVVFVIVVLVVAWSLRSKPTSKDSGSPPASPDNGRMDEISSLRDEVRRLSGQISALVLRVGELERRQGLQPQAEEPPPAVEEPGPVIADRPEPAVEAGEAIAAAARSAIRTEREVWAPPEPEQPPARPPAPREPSAIEREWEQILGGNWLARIGVFSLILGVGFFLKFAFDRNWLDPTGRVVLGGIGGLLLLAGGWYWHRKYPIFSQTLSGGGIALFYLSVYAAYFFYGLMGFIPALLLLFFTSVFGALLALWYDSMALAVISIIGAFVAPFILALAPSRGPVSITGTPTIGLISYVVVIDIGVLVMAALRRWRWLTLMTLAGSLAVFGVWNDRFGADAGQFTVQLSLTLIFLIFVGATMLYNVIWRRVPEAIDYTLMFSNAMAYFGISWGLLYSDFGYAFGLFALFLAFFYGGLSYLVWTRNAPDSRLALFSLGIALFFFTISIPLTAGDRVWATIAWATQGAIVIWLGTKYRLWLLRLSGYLAFTAAGLRLIISDTMYFRAVAPVLNERFLAFAFSIAAMYVAGYLLWRARESLEEKTAHVVFMLAANLFTLWIIGAEILRRLHGAPSHSADWPLLLLVPLAGLTVIGSSVWRRPFGDLANPLLVLDAVFYLIMIAFLQSDFGGWTGGLFFVTALVYGITAGFAWRRTSSQSGSTQLSAGIALLFLAVAIQVQLGDVVWTTVTWSVLFSLLVWLSFRMNFTLFRSFAYALLAAVIVRLFFFDSQQNVRDFVPFINGRFLSYAVAVAAVYVSGAVVRRNRERLTDKESANFRIYPVLFIIANVLSIIVLSLEVWGYFSRLSFETPLVQEKATLRSARNLALTGLWTLYAVGLLVVGIRISSRTVRVAGLMFLSIPIIKVYVYDVFALEQLYRIIAFVGLGVLLIASGYLYQRYRVRIRGFIASK